MLHPLPHPRVKRITIIIDSNSFLSSFIFVYILNEPFFILGNLKHIQLDSEYVLWDCFFTQLYAQYSFLSY